MAGDWIKMRTGIRRHPKVIAMARFLCVEREFMDWWSDPVRMTCRDAVTEIVTMENVMRVTVCGLLEVWGMLNAVIKDENRVNFMRLNDIDDLAGIPLFGEAMAYVGWVRVIDEESGEGLEFTNFGEFNTPESERRKAKTDAERAREYRERKRVEAAQIDRHDSSRNVTKNHAPSRGEEKSREEKNRKTVNPYSSSDDDGSAPPTVHESPPTKRDSKTDPNESVDPALWERFWGIWPRKTAKQSAIKAFNRLNPDQALVDRIGEHIRQRILSGEWSEQRKQYIPHPATFLNQQRWTDEILPPNGPGERYENGHGITANCSPFERSRERAIAYREGLIREQLGKNR